MATENITLNTDSIGELGYSIGSLCLNAGHAISGKDVKFQLLGASFCVNDESFLLKNLNEVVDSARAMKPNRYDICKICITCSDKFKTRMAALAMEGSVSAGYDTSYPSGWTPKYNSIYEYHGIEVEFIGNGEENRLAIGMTYTDSKVRQIKSWINHMKSTGMITDDDARKLTETANNL